MGDGIASRHGFTAQPPTPARSARCLCGSVGCSGGCCVRRSSCQGSYPTGNGPTTGSPVEGKPNFKIFAVEVAAPNVNDESER